MQIENSQCQIARAQIGRYVAGEAIPEDVLAALEAHLEDCDDCRAVVTEQRAALQSEAGMDDDGPATEPIDPPNLTEAFDDVVQPPSAFAPSNDASSSGSSVVTKTRANPVSEWLSDIRAGRKRFGHPLVWSGMLAIVLVALSYFVKNPTGLLGSKVIKETKVKHKADMVEPVASEVPASVVAEPVPDPPAKEAPVEPKEQAVSTPDRRPHAGSSHKALVDNSREPEAIRAARKRTPRPAPAPPRASAGTIKVYDAAGNPIQP